MNGRKIIDTLGVVIVVMTALHFSAASRAEFVAEFLDLTAEVEMTFWSLVDQDDPAVVKTRVWHLQCVVGTNTWLIRDADQGGLREAWWYTGSNLVWQAAPGDGLKGHSVRAESPAPTRTFDFSGNLDSGSNGPFLPPHFHIAWLAFCSGPYLDQRPREVPMPSTLWKEYWLYFDYNSPPKGFEDKTVQFENHPKLPISIDLYTKKGQPLFQYRLQHGRGPSPLSTNVLGWELPLEFRAVQYLPAGKSRENWQVYLTARGKLTSLKAGHAPHFQPSRETFRHAQNK